jgi:site-specific recombinase XerC
MRRDPKTGSPDFYAFARDYLNSYLPTVARRSPTTIQAYRISLECLLDYLAEQHNIERAHISFDHFDRDHLKGWLTWMIDQRHYAANTVALRLSTVKAFLAYCSAEEPHPRHAQSGSEGPTVTSHCQEADRVPHRAADSSRTRGLHRPHREVAQKPDAADLALRHSRPRR